MSAHNYARRAIGGAEEAELPGGQLIDRRANVVARRDGLVGIWTIRETSTYALAEVYLTEMGHDPFLMGHDPFRCPHLGRCTGGQYPATGSTSPLLDDPTFIAQFLDEAFGPLTVQLGDFANIRVCQGAAGQGGKHASLVVLSGKPRIDIVRRRFAELLVGGGGQSRG